MDESQNNYSENPGIYIYIYIHTHTHILIYNTWLHLYKHLENVN